MKVMLHTIKMPSTAPSGLVRPELSVWPEEWVNGKGYSTEHRRGAPRWARIIPCAPPAEADVIFYNQFYIKTKKDDPLALIDIDDPASMALFTQGPVLDVGTPMVVAQEINATQYFWIFFTSDPQEVCR